MPSNKAPMTRRSVMAAGAACLMASSSAGAFDAFLQIKNAGEDVPTDAAHSWVDVLGFTHGADSVADEGQEVPRFEPRVCTLQVAQDRSLANLMDALAMGRPRDLTLQVARMTAEQVTVAYEIQLKGCLFRKIAATLDEDASEPFFDVELAYTEILWTVTFPERGNKYLAIGSGYDALEGRLIDRGTILPPQPGAYAGGGGTDPEPDGDLDDDGLPDAWEIANGLDPNSGSDASGDLDKDGFSNRDEYIAGTDPRSGTSFFRAAVSGISGGVVLTWNSVPGKTYTVLATQDLSQPFQPIGTVTAGNGSQSSYTTSTTAGRFFKLSVTE